MKKLLQILLSIIDEKIVIGLVLDFLQKQSEKSKNEIDDKLIALLIEKRAYLEDLAKKQKEKITNE